MKHSVPKNDKKRRKEVGATAEKMEKSLKDRQEKVVFLIILNMRNFFLNQFVFASEGSFVIWCDQFFKKSFLLE